MGDRSAKGSHPAKKSVFVLILYTGGGGSCPNPNFLKVFFCSLFLDIFHGKRGTIKLELAYKSSLLVEFPPKSIKNHRSL